MQIRARMSMVLTADPVFDSGESHGIQAFLEGCEAALMGRTISSPPSATTAGRGRT